MTWLLGWRLGLALLAALLVVACDDSPSDDATPASLRAAPTWEPETIPTREPEVEIRISPGASIQEVVDANPPGTAFLIEAGIHRLQTVTPRDGDAFRGEPGAVLSGARVLDGFEREGDYWVADEQEQQIATGGRCASVDGERGEACTHPEQLFVDGVPLRQVTVLDDVDQDSWYFDYKADRIYMAVDPAGRLVEASVTETAFLGPAQDVVISDLVIEQYASRAQAGAVDGSDGRDWTVERNEIRLNHAYGVRTGDGMVLAGNRIHHNGQIGVGGSGDGILVEHNEIAYNNTAGFASGWEAGGTKFVNTRDLVVRNNWVHHNDGSGLWTDINNIDSLIEGNTVEWNAERGIVHEISYDAVIRGNTVRFNGLGFDTWVWGAQILVQNSPNVQVYDNQVVIHPDGGDGLVVVNQDRGDGGIHGPWVSRNVSVTDNEVVYLSSFGSSGIADDTGEQQACSDDAGNEFRDNTFYVPSTEDEVWQWCGSGLGWDEFQARASESGALHALGSDVTLDDYLSAAPESGGQPPSR